MHLVFSIVFCLFSFLVKVSNAADIQQSLLNVTIQTTYGSVQHERNENSNLEESEVIDILIPGNTPFEKILVPHPDIFGFLLTYLDLQGQINLVCTSRYIYKMLYPLIEFEVIAQKLQSNLHKDPFFADRIPHKLNRVVTLFQHAESLSGQNTQRFKNLYKLYSTEIHVLKDEIQQAKDTPTLSFAMRFNGALKNNLSYLNQMDNYQPITKTRWINFCWSSLRDRRFLGTMGILGLGIFGTLTYFVITEQVQAQAFETFMNQTQIPRFLDTQVPVCFQTCLQTFSSDNFTDYGNSSAYINDWPNCESDPFGCFCDAKNCFTIDNKNGTSNYFFYVRTGTISEWITYMSSRCHFINKPSGFWPQFIQRIANKSSKTPDNTNLFYCAPNPDNETVTCGSNYECSPSGSICMSLYTGHASCVAHDAWKSHLLHYFVPASLLVAGTISGILANWYCYSE